LLEPTIKSLLQPAHPPAHDWRSIAADSGKKQESANGKEALH